MLSAQTRDNVRISVLVGVVMATIYAAYATVVYLGHGSEAFKKHDSTFGTVIAAYYSAGILGGLIVGLLLRLPQGWPRAVLLGLVSSFMACFCIEVAMSGPFWHWKADNWEEVLVLGGVFSLVGTYLFRPK